MAKDENESSGGPNERSTGPAKEMTTEEREAAFAALAWKAPLLYQWCEEIEKKPTPTYFLNPIIPADACIMISGRQKVAKKSYFCRKLAIKLATGKPFKPWGAPIGPIRVLYFDQEGPEKLSQIRWKVIEKSEGIRLTDVKTFFYTHREAVALDRDEWVMKVCKFIKIMQIQLVFLDPLAKCHTSDENDEQDLVPVLHAMDAFRKCGASVVFVHHLRKEEKKIILAEDIDKDARGSTSIAAHYDTHLGFRATKTEENLMLYVVGKHMEPHTYAVKWDIDESNEDVAKRHATVDIHPIKEKEKKPKDKDPSTKKRGRPAKERPEQ